MKITKLKLKSKNNPNIFIATTETLDYVLHADMIVKYSIHLGEIDEDKLKKCERDSAEIIALDLAVKYMANAVKSTKQVRDYLKKKGYDNDIIRSVLDKLKEYNLINDESFADNYISSNPKFSTLKLKQKLASFGLNQDIISTKLEEIDEYPACKMQAEKFIKNKPMDEKLKEKLIRRLNYQGYKFDTIRRVLNELDLGDVL